MASQTNIGTSPDGRFLAAQVHQMWCIADQTTGAIVPLPPPTFARVADGADDAEEDAEGDDDGADGGAAESPAAGSKPSKKARHAQDKPGSGKGQRSHDGPKPVRVLAFHPTAPWMVVNTEEKYLHLYHGDASYANAPAAAASASAATAPPAYWKHILTVVIPRKVQAAVFKTGFGRSSTYMSPQGGSELQIPQLIVADKTGDIFVLSGVDLATQTMELGHLANITHMQFYFGPHAAAITSADASSSCGSSAGSSVSKKYLLTSDSDGKIRVSNFPNYFDIQSFCLGHQAFVSSFAVMPLTHPLIVSGGLGSEIILWNLNTGAELGRFDLAAHKAGETKAPDAAASSAAASSSPASSSAVVSSNVAESAAASCYISSVQLLHSTDGVHRVAVAVYPWPSLFFLSYTPATHKHFRVDDVLALPSTPMCFHVTSPSPSAAHAGQAQHWHPKLFVIDQSLEFHAYTTTAASGSGSWELAKDPASTSLLSSLSGVFAEARACLGETLITPENAGDFIGAGTVQPKHAAQTDEQRARAEAAAASGNSGRYISPFSSLHSGHLQRLNLLNPGGFAFRRFFDKIQRDRYVSGKKQEAAQRQAENRRTRTQNKKDNARKKKEEAEAAAAGEEDDMQEQ